MAFIDRLEAAEQKIQNRWKGTFRDFLKVFESKLTSLGAIAHQRIETMIMSAGTDSQEYFGRNRIKYNFFEDVLYGIEPSIDQIMGYIHAAARKTETSRRMLLLYGPPSSGKSDLVIRIKRGLEAFTHQDEGAVFALQGSDMHENPFLLIPHDMRDEFKKQYGISIEGDLSPHSAWRLENDFEGKFLEYPVEQIFISEAKRVGIGTFLPSDPKVQDTSELVGGIDFAKIQEVGNEGDPRAFNLNGELEVANRGLMEFVEGLKCCCKNTRIPTSKGLIKFADFHGSERQPLVAAEKCQHISNGFKPGMVTRTCYKGQEECVEVRSRLGYKIEASLYHHILCVDEDGKPEWKELKDLVPGEQMLMSFDSVWTRTVPRLPKIKSGTNFPKHLTGRLARLLGYFVAEGSYSIQDGKRYGVRISNTDEQMITDVQEIANSLGLKASPYPNEGSITIHSRALCDLFEQLGLTARKAVEKRVPEIIFRSPARLVAEFISAYFDGDGTVTDNDIACSSASEELVSDIQLLLLNFGIVSAKRSTLNEKYQRHYWNLSISSVDYDKFVDDIGFNLNRKQSNAISRKQSRINHRDSLPVKYLFQSIHDRLRILSNELDCSIAPKRYSDVIGSHLISRKSYNDVWAYSNGARNASRDSVTRIAQELGAIPQLTTLSTMLSQIGSAPVFLDTVERITPIGVQDVFDLHEVTEHSYAAHGFINHNSDEKLLRVLLTVTQERQIKAPRFGLISIDCCLIMHSNEEEFKTFMAERRYEAYHDRMVIVKVPYNLGIKDEVRIYDKLLSDSDLSIRTQQNATIQTETTSKMVHIAPHTLEAAAMFAVLTRLEPPADLTLVTKMKLYDNQHVKGYKPSSVCDMRKQASREGMSGISPRFVIDQINTAIAKAAEDGRGYITALDVLRQLLNGVQSRDSFSKEEKARYEQLVDLSRNEWNDLLRNDIQKAFFLCFEDEARNLCDNYLQQIEMSLSDEKQRDPITGNEIKLNEKLMENIEAHLSVSRSGVDDFRNEILRFFGTAARKGQKVDYSQHAQLREAIQKQLFEERQGTIRMTVSTRNPDPEALRRLNDLIDRMVQQQGYTAESANELLKYATAHLFDK
jgi:predicted Ser/Thr protein kinase/intein/homing endonuclease